LGLASVEKIMNMHGGRVWVESEIGQGATFWIAFPDPPRRQRQRGFGRVPLTKGPGIGCPRNS
jgi:K+-sensing histidine kinase KdpD